MDNSNKSLLILSNYPPPYGGVPRHIEYLTSHLIEKGWKVHIIAWGNHENINIKGMKIYDWNRYVKHARSIKNLIKFRFLFLKLFYMYPEDWHRYINIIELGKKIIKKNNISVISAYNLHSYAPAGAVLSHLLNIPLFVTNFGEIYSFPKFFNDNRRITKLVIDKSYRLLAMSDHCADSYNLLDFHPKVEVIRYGVDLNIFENNSLNKKKISKKFPIKNDNIIVLYLGRITKEMGLNTIIKSVPMVLSKCKSIKFIIAGERGDLEEAVISLKNRYAGNVFLEFSIPFEELVLFYNAADIVIAPTQGDRACGSLAAIEAMALGKPVIASNVGGIPEIVVNNETGILVEPGNPDALSRAIIKLVNDKSTMQHMGLKGRRRVERLFNERDCDKKLEGLFLEAHIAKVAKS